MLLCSGDTVEQRTKMIGHLKGTLNRGKDVLGKAGIGSIWRAQWWRQQLNGILGWHACGLVPSKLGTQELQVISNRGARFVGLLAEQPC